MRNLSVTDCDSVPSEYDAIHVYLGELEIQCIATSETYAGWEFRREDEIAGFSLSTFLSQLRRILDRAQIKHENPASSHSHQVQTQQGLTD